MNNVFFLDLEDPTPPDEALVRDIDRVALALERLIVIGYVSAGMLGAIFFVVLLRFLTR